MMSLKRETVGFAIAPLPVVVPLIFLFGFILLDQPDHRASVLEAMLLGILGCYGATLLIGLPIHSVLRRLGRRALFDYLGATALCVAAIAGVMAILAVFAAMTPAPMRNPHGLLTSSIGLYVLLVFAALSLVCASVFWFVSVRQRHR